MRQPIRKDGGEQIEDGMSVQMFDAQMPTMFEYFDAACDWVRFNFVRIVGVCAAAGFVAGVYFTYFWS